MSHPTDRSPQDLAQGPLSSRYTPDGKQQHTASNNTPIAHPDGPDVSNDSQGNQAVKEAVKNLHPRDLAQNLDPTQPAPAQAQQSGPPFAAYATGALPDTRGMPADPAPTADPAALPK